MSCGCPNCLSPKTVFGRSGPIGTATPYADGTNLFQRICFSPPFLTATKDAVNCVDTFATQAGCVYNAECGSGQVCHNATCVPRNDNFLIENTVGSNDIYAQNPQVVDSFAPGDMRVAAHIPAPFNQTPETIRMFIEKTCPQGGGGLLLTKCAGPGNNLSLVCPHFPGHVKERNCSNSLRSLTKCDMFRGVLDDEQYKACKQREDCFQYDIALGNGTIHPMGYKVSPQCVAYAAESLNTCAQDCSPIDKAYF
jgi:hypothetical protein